MAYTLRMKRDETQKMAALYRAGYSCAEIAKVHGIKRQAVHQRLVKAGVTMRGMDGKPKDQIASDAPST